MGKAKIAIRTGRFKKLQKHKSEGLANKWKKKKEKEPATKPARINKPQKSSKHKKIKAVDPFYTGERQSDRNAKLINRAPHQDDDSEHVTFSMREMVRLKSEGKNPKKKVRRKQRLRELGPGAEFTDHTLNVTMERGMSKPLKAVPKFSQGKKESNQAFVNRIESLSQQVILKAKFEDKYKVNVDDISSDKVTVKHKSKKHKKEMQRLKVKKQKKLEKVREKQAEKRTDTMQTKDYIAFGEVAMEPPSLTAKPRTVAEKTNRPGARSLLLNDIMRDNRNNAGLGNTGVVHQRKLGQTVRRKNMSVAEKRLIDGERQRAIELYRNMRAAKYNEDKK